MSQTHIILVVIVGIHVASDALGWDGRGEKRGYGYVRLASGQNLFGIILRIVFLPHLPFWLGSALGFSFLPGAEPGKMTTRSDAFVWTQENPV